MFNYWLSDLMGRMDNDSFSWGATGHVYNATSEQGCGVILVWIDPRKRLT